MDIDFLTLIGNLERQYIMAKQDNKTFTIAGVATHNGVTKARFANDMVARIKILTKAGATNVNLVELPKPMTKIEALEYLQSLGTFTGDAGYAIANRAADKIKAQRRGEVKVTLKTGGKSTKAPTLVNATSKVEA